MRRVKFFIAGFLVGCFLAFMIDAFAKFSHDSKVLMENIGKPVMITGDN